MNLRDVTFPLRRRGPGRVRRRWAGQPTAARMENWLRLASSGWYLHLDDIRRSGDVAELVAADASWYFAVEDWFGRRPHRWQRAAWRSWRQAEQALADEQARLVAAAGPLRTLRPFSDAAN